MASWTVRWVDAELDRADGCDAGRHHKASVVQCDLGDTDPIASTGLGDIQLAVRGFDQ